jgi:hypothetical protein
VPVSQTSGLEQPDAAIVPEVVERMEVDREEVAAFSKSDINNKLGLYVRNDKIPKEKPMKMTKKVDEEAEWLPPKLEKEYGQRRGKQYFTNT